MEATNQLRFVERRVQMHPFYKTTNERGEMVTAYRTYNVLQQLWVKKEWAHEHHIIVEKEWRDVPMEKEESA